MKVSFMTVYKEFLGMLKTAISDVAIIITATRVLEGPPDQLLAQVQQSVSLAGDIAISFGEAALKRMSRYS